MGVFRYLSIAVATQTWLAFYFVFLSNMLIVNSFVFQGKYTLFGELVIISLESTMSFYVTGTAHAEEGFRPIVTVTYFYSYSICGEKYANSLKMSILFLQRFLRYTLLTDRWADRQKGSRGTIIK